MTTIRHDVDVNASADRAWELVGDIAAYRRVMVGITRWDPVPGQDSHFWILMQVGSIATGGEVVVEVDDAARTLSWASIRGTEHHAKISLAATGPDSCRVSVDFTYRLTGPVAGLVELTARPIVVRNLIATLETLRHVVEHDDLLL